MLDATSAYVNNSRARYVYLILNGNLACGIVAGFVFTIYDSDRRYFKNRTLSDMAAMTQRKGVKGSRYPNIT